MRVVESLPRFQQTHLQQRQVVTNLPSDAPRVSGCSSAAYGKGDYDDHRAGSGVCRCSPYSGVVRLDEIVTTVVLMLVAGYETSIGLISAAIRHLLCDPAAARTLRQHPAAVPGAIAEILRYDGADASGPPPTEPDFSVAFRRSSHGHTCF
jgi:hypothetical protein